MFKRLIASALVFGAAAMAPPPAAAGPAEITPAQGRPPACGPRAQVRKQLEQRYGEAPTGAGIIDPRQALEVWSSAKTGTWTLLVTRVDGISCVVAAGSSWHRAIPTAASGDGA